MTTLPHQLSDDVYACLSDDRIVFLDLRKNEYLCLNPHNTQIAISLFSGSTRSDITPAKEKRATDDEDTRLVVRALTNRGLLAQSGTNGNEATSVRFQAPESFLLPEGGRPMPTVRPGHWTAFLHASLTASWKLRWYSMQRTVRSIENRKQRRDNTQATGNEPLRELVAIFHHLRPFYVRKYLCLYDSLALVEFLAHYRLFPQWIFGVKTGPFNAHCWVQENDCVLNDAVEYVRGFTPIMAV